MKKVLFLLVFLVFISAISFAKYPELKISTDKTSYGRGETGIIFIEVNTYGQISDAEIEAEITNQEGEFVYGEIMHTEIPEKTQTNQNQFVTEQVIYNETIDYITPEKKIERKILFEIPETVPEGEYKLNVRLTAAKVLLSDSAEIKIQGAGKPFEFLILLYLITAISSMCLLWRGM